MAVEDRAGGVADRVLHVVALDEHGVEAGDAARRRGAGALEQLGQQGEDARRVAARGRRLAGRQPDLALRHGDAGQAVHHQHDVPAVVAEPLGDPGGDERRPQSHDRRLVGGRDDDDGAGQALGAEVVLEELADLAATLADQGDHRDLGVGAAGDHREQARLADAGAGHDADALAAAARRERVQGAYAEAELVVDPRAGQGGRGAVGRPRPAAGVAARDRRRWGGRGRRARGRAARRRPRIRSGPPVCRDVVADAQAVRVAERQAGEPAARRSRRPRRAPGSRHRRTSSRSPTAAVTARSTRDLQPEQARRPGRGAGRRPRGPRAGGRRR